MKKNRGYFIRRKKLRDILVQKKMAETAPA